MTYFHFSESPIEILPETVGGSIANISPLRVKALGSYYPAKWNHPPNCPVEIGTDVQILGYKGITLIIRPA